ncbi:MAG: pantoate--beta-alanine ligase [Oligoflexia bacterium]|nr:pantoate--beta-alanine ligase [Oligoflexia bacterium]
MDLYNTKAELSARLTAENRKGRRIALVPTMGALHAGHLSLIQIAKQHADLVVMSLFVNPKQFNSGDDFKNYPRSVEQDAAMAAAAGVDLMFAPSTEQIYPSGIGSGSEAPQVTAGSASRGLCGAGRPGHFDGVATVVAILFNIVRPDCAVFGEKDYQQLKVIEQLNRVLHFDIEIIPAPLVRDQDGIAFSSRNARLAPAEREALQLLPRALFKARELFWAGERNSATLISAMQATLASSPLLRPEYLEVVDTELLERIEKIQDRAQVMAALWCGAVRLIDNIRLDAGEII